MFQKYVEEGGLFLITNKTVALHRPFADRHYCERFLFQLRRYVGPLGQIVGYALLDDEFSFIIKLGSRGDFLNYHIQRQKFEKRMSFPIPDSTYIFSQAMANLQVSTAKYFNGRENRSGAFFAGRFKKQKIKDGKELGQILDRLRKSIPIRTYVRKWSGTRSKALGNRRSWCFNFQGLAELKKEWNAWRMKGSAIGEGLEVWVVKMERVLQGRLRKTHFFTKIPFDLPFINPLNPP